MCGVNQSTHGGGCNNNNLGNSLAIIPFQRSFLFLVIISGIPRIQTLPYLFYCPSQGFLNYGSQPQMGSLNKALGSRDFNGLHDRVAVVQFLSCRTEWLWYVLLSFIKKFKRKNISISSCANLKINHLS